MPDLKISELPVDASITGVEQVPLADAGTTKQVALSALATYIGTIVNGRPSFLCTPVAAAFPTANFPHLLKNSGTNWTDYTLDYDQTTSESAFWYFVIPTGITFTTADLEIFSRQAAATSGTVGWTITTLTRAGGEAFDTAGNANTVTANAVEGTAGMVHRQTVSLTVTGWAAGEVLLVKIARDIADTVAEDAKFINAVIRLG